MFLRDLLAGDDADIDAAVSVISAAAPDVLVLQGLDYDAGHQALTAFADVLAKAGAAYPHRHATLPNSGLPTGIDLDGDGRLGTARDAQGYGRFSGASGMAVLSRFPVIEARDFSDLLWADLPGNLIEAETLPEEALAVQRLSSHGHWVVRIAGPGDRPFEIWAYHAAPPVFDGPEDRNGRRNHDETAFWLRYLDGAFGPAGRVPFVLAGDANLDPQDGEGRRGALAQLLAHPRINDPFPESADAVTASIAEGGANARHRGNPAFDTVNWRDDPGPGNLRVDYVLPSRDWDVAGAGVVWPKSPVAAGGDGGAGSRHGLVWADLILTGGS